MGLATTAPARAADGAALFVRCAACHLATGAGVPGAHPQLGAQIPRYARNPAGREYMVTVVSHGLAGAVTVAETSYNGFMPAQNLSDDEVAAVLNYVASTIAAAKPQAKPFTAAEVAAIRARHGNAMAQDSRSLRPDRLAEDGR